MAGDRIDSSSQSYTHYTHDDLAKWAGSENASTVRVMNQIRKDAGYHDYVEFGADDMTANETRAEQEELSLQNLSLPAASATLHILAAGLEEAAVGAGLVGASLLVEIAATGKEIVAGDHLRAAIDRDQMKSAMVAVLDLPQGFKDELQGKLMSKYTEGWNSANQKMAVTALLQDRSKMALVQIHADQGANAAVKMLDGHTDRRAFFAANLGAAQRYATDPAFHVGFDALEWAHAHGAQYGKAKVELNARDAAYGSAHVRVSA